MKSTTTTAMQSKNKKPVIVRQVWADNLEFEISQIKKAIPQYPFVAMDTEFPGTILKLNFDDRYMSPINPELNYFIMKSNVDLLQIIQLGLTLSDSEGNMPSFGTEFSVVWEFNFRDFDIDRDYQNIKSIGLLVRQGIDFEKNKEKGIDSWDFARLVLNSGLVFNSNSLTWVTFHSAYDFGLLIKILTRQNLPINIDKFVQLVINYFGFKVYDMKHMIKFTDDLRGGLERVAKLLHVERQAGKSHQAGSDSLLTMQTFLKFKDKEEANTGLNNFECMLYGLEVYENDLDMLYGHDLEVYG